MTSERLKYFFPLWWSLQVFKHKILRKNIYIIVDAINENDSKEFLETFEDGIYSLIKHNNVKVVERSVLYKLLAWVYMKIVPRQFLFFYIPFPNPQFG